MFSYETSVKSFRVPKEEDGEETTFTRVTVRKIILTNLGEVSSILPQAYQITKIKRKGVTSFSIKGLFPPKQPLWQSLCLDVRKQPKPEWKQVEQGLSLTKVQTRLGKYIGVNSASKALEEIS